MKPDYLKYYKSKVLIFLISILFLIVLLSKNHWGLSISIMGTISILLIIITDYLWKYKPFIWLFNIDNFSGHYEGIIKYHYKDKSGKLITNELKHVKIINQTGSRITIFSFTFKPDGTKSSLSVNKGMYVEKTEDGKHYRLIYNYLNQGSSKQEFPPHYGTDILKFLNNKDGKILSGRYFTEREPYQTKGEYIKLKWISNNSNHEF